jgi:phosphodiesterase/alkaline phosphatase D-like protein
MKDDVYAGEMQMQWLKDQLKVSDAVFKIIVHGGTIVRAGDESWFTHSKLEQRELLDFLAENEITGVVFHGGDIHKNLFNPFPDCPGNGTLDYEVYEIVSSGLTIGGGRFTIVDIDTSKSLPTLTYQMIEAGVLQEQGMLTVLDGSVSGQAPGVMRHEIMERSTNMTYPSCQARTTSHAFPVIGGIE